MPASAGGRGVDAAPTRPACSDRGAKARPVAGPPVSVAEPASTPNIGSSPNDVATPIPTRFCTPANPDASARNTITCLPRSDEPTSQLQSLKRPSYAVFCLKKKRLSSILKTHILSSVPIDQLQF